MSNPSVNTQAPTPAAKQFNYQSAVAGYATSVADASSNVAAAASAIPTDSLFAELGVDDNQQTAGLSDALGFTNTKK